MAVTNLKCLVLHGSAALVVGKTGNPCLGSGVLAYSQALAISISMPRPLQGRMQGLFPAWRLGHAEDRRADSRALSGAGRSLCCIGALRRG